MLIDIEKLRRNLSLHFLLVIILLVASCSQTEKSDVKHGGQSKYALPYLKETNGIKQLIVDGSPYIIIGGELMNSSASSIEYMEPVWPHLTSMNVNTVLLPITWQQLEPVEGDFDYTLVDSHIENARKNDLRIIFLWFGSWKNGMSHYTPDWVKTDLNRFPRMQFENGKITPVISNINEECLKADKKAYLMLMKRIAQIDKDRTVLMMQIENEVGLLGDSRDYSSAATELFEQNVPEELIQFIYKNSDEIKPVVRDAYTKNGSKSKGSWEEVFGKSKDTDEMFMAWHYARYINELSKAGKEIHNIPTLVNAWAANAEEEPGDWPSGGPNYRMLDIWLAGAPEVDILATDNYTEKFNEKCMEFIHQDNPLFIPEACAIWLEDTISAPAKAFYTIGHFNAICFSPFGIDHENYHSNHPVKSAYKVLNQLMPFITQAQIENKVNAFMEFDPSTPSSFELGDYKFTAVYKRKKAPHIKGFGMVIQTADDEFIITGNAFELEVESRDNNKPNAQLISVEEGMFVEGNWKRQRILNGDEFGLKFPAKPYDLIENVVLGEMSIHKVKMFKY